MEPNIVLNKEVRHKNYIIRGTKKGFSGFLFLKMYLYII